MLINRGCSVETCGYFIKNMNICEFVNKNTVVFNSMGIIYFIILYRISCEFNNSLSLLMLLLFIYKFSTNRRPENEVCL
ncbi:MAG: hypothetical protein Ta2B_00380 [Termitinemataceae bacterium]|nr:MAG: hypothetical protein Ta2B_00380 [Termitinemataceae bacterium]